MSVTGLDMSAQAMTSLVLVFILGTGLTTAQTISLEDIAYQVESELKQMSSQCQSQAESCSKADESAKGFYMVKQYCVLIQPPYSCLTNGNVCTTEEADILQSVACQGKRPFIQRIIDLPKTCQDTIGKCLVNAVDIKALLLQRKYCEAMTYKDEDEDTHACLVTISNDSKCSQSDYDSLKEAACINSSASSIVFTFTTCIMLVLLGVGVI